jgi:hypothetical protein
LSKAWFLGWIIFEILYEISLLNVVASHLFSGWISWTKSKLDSTISSALSGEVVDINLALKDVLYARNPLEFVFDLSIWLIRDLHDN